MIPPRNRFSAFPAIDRARRRPAVSGGAPSVVTPSVTTASAANGSNLLTLTPAVWSSGGAARQWYCNPAGGGAAVAITGETGLTYTFTKLLPAPSGTVSPCDLGATVFCRESNGGATADSNAVAFSMLLDNYVALWFPATGVSSAGDPGKVVSWTDAKAGTVVWAEATPANRFVTSATLMDGAYFGIQMGTGFSATSATFAAWNTGRARSVFLGAIKDQAADYAVVGAIISSPTANPLWEMRALNAAIAGGGGSGIGLVATGGGGYGSRTALRANIAGTRGVLMLDAVNSSTNVVQTLNINGTSRTLTTADNAYVPGSTFSQGTPAWLGSRGGSFPSTAILGEWAMLTQPSVCAERHVGSRYGVAV